MADSADMIVRLLCEMRAKNAARHAQLLEKLAAIGRRLDGIVDALQRKAREWEGSR